jgi:hypothetical protein
MIGSDWRRGNQVMYTVWSETISVASLPGLVKVKKKIFKKQDVKMKTHHTREDTP